MTRRRHYRNAARATARTTRDPRVRALAIRVARAADPAAAYARIMSPTALDAIASNMRSRR